MELSIFLHMIFYREEAIVHTRKLYLEANQELTSAKTKVSELQAELSSRDRDLVSAKTDCRLHILPCSGLDVNKVKQWLLWIKRRLML